MGLFFKKSSTAGNRIENSGRWPVRFTRFSLVDDYDFPATNFPEIFFVLDGHFLHVTDAGTQVLRQGSALVIHPGCRHKIQQPEEMILVRIRFLPEWLTQEYALIANSPDVLTLFFDQSWFRYPRDENFHVFTTRDEDGSRIREELTCLRSLLRDKRNLEPVMRVSLLKLMMLLADEYRRFWRGVAEVEVLPEAKYALDEIENTILRGAPYSPEKMAREGFGKQAIESAFEDLTGMTPAEYARRRRVFHGACKLLTSNEEQRRISERLGFSSVREFTTEFEAVFDISPEVYRDKFGMEEGTPLLPVELEAPEEA